MDTWNGTYNAQVDESLELNETAPINYNNQNQNYMTNEAREISVESINIDNGYEKSANIQLGNSISHQTEMIQEESYVLIWKYLEQIKSISAGLK